MCRGKLYYEKASVRRGEGVDREVDECVGENYIMRRLQSEEGKG
jgi:hypothetical protein